MPFKQWRPWYRPVVIITVQLGLDLPEEPLEPHSLFDVWRRCCSDGGSRAWRLAGDGCATSVAVVLRKFASMSVELNAFLAVVRLVTSVTVVVGLVSSVAVVLEEAAFMVVVVGLDAFLAVIKLAASVVEAFLN